MVGFDDNKATRKKRVVEENESEIQETDSKISLVSEPKLQDLS